MQPRTHLMQFSLDEPFGKTTMHVLDWGNEGAQRVVVCVHGLTRNAHDFDVIAAQLAAQGARVFSLDMPGRGGSPWLENKMLYGYPLYVALCMAFMDNFHLRGVEWIGTSMGGLIGMMIATDQPKRISKLVMNDIGARISAGGIGRIMDYVRTLPRQFESREVADVYLRKAFAPFGIADTDVWSQFVAHSLHEEANGVVRLKTDPDIAAPLLAAMDQTAGAPVDLSSVWEQVRCPSLIIRGENSDLLSAETANAMLAVNLKAETVTMRGCGHAPSLTTAEQIAPVVRFLSSRGNAFGRAVGV